MYYKDTSTARGDEEAQILLNQQKNQINVPYLLGRKNMGESADDDCKQDQRQTKVCKRDKCKIIKDCKFCGISYVDNMNTKQALQIMGSNPQLEGGHGQVSKIKLS